MERKTWREECHVLRVRNSGLERRVAALEKLVLKLAVEAYEELDYLDEDSGLAAILRELNNHISDYK